MYQCSLPHRQLRRPIFYKGTIGKAYGDKLAQYLTTGLQIYITGVPNVNAWIDKTTNEGKATISINITSLNMLGNNKTIETSTSVLGVLPSSTDDIPF